MSPEQLAATKQLSDASVSNQIGKIFAEVMSKRVGEMRNNVGFFQCDQGSML
jgi:hypothetical protein